MALKKDVVINEQKYRDAYISFGHIILENKIEETGNRHVRAVLFAREVKSDDRILCYYNCDFVYDLSSIDNLWVQAYAAAKQLPEMDGAEDV